MSIKCLQTIVDENTEYKNGDIITNITREDADRLIKLKVAIKIDDKFKRNTKDLRKVYANKYKKNKLGGGYEF